MSLGELYEVTLLEKQMLTKDIMVLKFSCPSNFEFVAGQFVRFLIKDEAGEHLRSFSISSAPGGSYLEFCVRILPNGKASNFFSALKPGGVAQITRPAGFFVAPESRTGSIVLVGTGTGIAPLASLTEALLAETPALRLSLIFGLRKEADIFWQGKFETLTKNHQNFKFVLTLSQAEPAWHGARGRVTDHISGYLDRHAVYYLCGSAPMVKDVRAILQKNGVESKNIRLEVY